MEKRFASVLKPEIPGFDSTFLTCTMFNPDKTTELYQGLFDIGQQHLRLHLLSSVADIVSKQSLQPATTLSTSTVFVEGDDCFEQTAKLNAYHHKSNESSEVSGPQPASNAAKASAPKRPNQKELDLKAAKQAQCKRRRMINEVNQGNQSQKEIIKDKMESEINDYLRILEKGLFKKDMEPSVFWIENVKRFPLISPIAFQFLVIPATSASTERLFFAAGLSTKGNRTCIGPKLLEAESCAKYNRKVLGI